MTDKRMCAKQETIAIIIKNGEFIVGSNWCENPQSVCPRIGLPTGVGYGMCRDICGQKNHAEVDACLKAGDFANGADLYLIGNYYCCDNCKKVMKEYGIKNIHILKPHAVVGDCK